MPNLCNCRRGLLRPRIAPPTLFPDWNARSSDRAYNPGYLIESGRRGNLAPPSAEPRAALLMTKEKSIMKRVLGILLTLSLMAGMMTMPAFAQGEAKKGAPAAEKKDGKQGDAKKS